MEPTRNHTYVAELRQKTNTRMFCIDGEGVYVNTVDGLKRKRGNANWWGPMPSKFEVVFLSGLDYFELFVGDSKFSFRRM